MNYSGIKYYDIANGSGVRTTLFVSGCRNHCEGCFQPETWSFDNGEEFTEDYKKLLAATGKANLKDVALMADIDITDKSFWKTSLDIICRDIDKLLEIMK